MLHVAPARSHDQAETSASSTRTAPPRALSWKVLHRRPGGCVCASVTVVGRSLSEDDSLEPNISFLRGDVSTVSECRSIAGKLPFEKCDVLAFTAGIVPKNTRKVSADGSEFGKKHSFRGRLLWRPVL